jgi:anti-anti-sigma factor
LDAKLRNHGEIAIVSINGPLDIEKTQPFRDVCKTHFAGRKVIFNLQETSFVGSTGIQFFIEAVRMLSTQNQTGIRLVGLKSEFRRIFLNLEIAGLEIHETEAAAITSWNLAVAAVVVGSTSDSIVFSFHMKRNETS